SFGGPAYPSMIAEIENQTPDEPVPVDMTRLDALLDSKMIEYYDAEALYQNQLKQSFDWKAIRDSGITVGYDAMYGAGQDVMRDLFPTATLLHCEHNPSFEGQAPEPIARNLSNFQHSIKAKGIQFGLATDGDADRIGLFDQNADFVDSHHILLLLVHYLHKYKAMKGKVVCTFSVTSKLKTLCDHYGIELQVTKIGFKYIGEIMANETVLVGGEESGGIAVAGHIPERDGIYIGLTLLEFMAETGKTLPELIQEVYDIVGSFKMGRNDLHIAEDKKWQVMDGCKAGDFKQFGDYKVESVEDIDGYKFHLGDDRWVMIRPSGTEPVLRVYAEADNDDRVADILKQALAAIEDYAG
ncbi:MAG: phosphoglucomutase/phosphomannomutase family protein, partial [Bacteroidota bacterium]